MNLELARQIMQEQIDYLATIEYPYSQEDFEVDTQNGNTAEDVLCIGSYWIKEHNLDTTKLYFSPEDQEGGEDCGSYYHIILKIDHPVHGVGYIKYVGCYDSWNDTEWYNDPVMVTPVKKMVEVTEWQESK